MARGRANRARQIIFRIFYSTSFTIVFLLTIAFSCAGPIDALYQSYRRGRIIDMFLIAGVYFLTGVLAIFLYASRLYTNRSILKDIPKNYMPVDKYELPGKRVWRLIEDCKSRSAVIAYEARPRARRIENELPHARDRINTLLRPERNKEGQIFDPQWGKISHPGWSSPAATETPNLAYATVIAELTDLIEARAVSLAPTRPNIPATTDQATEDELLADPYILEALSRPEEIGMRQYISQLISLDVLDNNSLSVAFLTLYERARFAPDPLTEDEFKSLMRMFAEILRSMRTLDITRLDLPEGYEETYAKETQDSTPVKNTKERMFAQHSVNESTPSIAESSSSAGSVRHRPGPPRISEDYPRSLSPSIGEDDRSDVYTDANDNWAAVTSRPPFLRAPTSNSRSTSHSRSNLGVGHSRPRNLASRISLRSKSSRLSMGRLRRRTSVESRDTAASMRSARSQGSVIRLVDDGDREGRMFEFIDADEEYDSDRNRRPPRRAD